MFPDQSRVHRKICFGCRHCCSHRHDQRHCGMASTMMTNKRIRIRMRYPGTLWWRPIPEDVCIRILRPDWPDFRARCRNRNRHPPRLRRLLVHGLDGRQMSDRLWWWRLSGVIGTVWANRCRRRCHLMVRSQRPQAYCPVRDGIWFSYKRFVS